MARFIAGDVLEIVCQHPTLGNYRFFPKANEDFTIDRGGIRSADDASMVTGSGQDIRGMNMVRWSVEGPIAVDYASDNEEKGVADLAADPEPGTWTVRHISGAVYKGTGYPVGDLTSTTNNAQKTLKISGGGKLEKI